MRRDLAALLSVLISIGLHAGFVAWLHREAPGPRPRTAVSSPEARAQAVVRGAGHAALGHERAGEIPVELGGPDSAQNVDRPERGEGGDGRARSDGLRLAMNVDDVRLQDAPWNAVGVAQVQRIATATSRASWDDRRATPNPHDQPFLASGEGRLRERRRVSVLEPNEGAPRARAQSAEGGAQQSPSAAQSSATQGLEERSSATQHPAPEAPGAEHASPGTGAVGGHGRRESAEAPVATGRPAVDEGPAATLAQERARPRDDTDSEQLATQLMQSWVDASPRAGRQQGAGSGGVGGGGAAGSAGGSGEGGQATAHAPGPGGRGALDTRDARYQSWLLAQRRRVYGAMVFPRERRLAMDQGIVVYSFQVDRAGHLVGSPHLARSSGFPDIDAAALRAIQAALPTAPPPTALMQGRNELPVRLHLDFSNPMVR